MKKEVLVSIFLVLLLTASLFNIHYLNKLSNDISARINAAVSSAEAENWTEAEKKTEEAIRMWKDSDTYTHLVLRHSEVESATDALYNMAEQVYAQDAGAVRGAGQAASSRLTSIASIERIRLGSIF
jgi:TRAP-type C4-dicarboxylate transport system substrate-binding protein